MYEHKAILKDSELKAGRKAFRRKKSKVSSPVMSIIVSPEKYKKFEENGSVIINIMSAGNIKSNLVKPFTGKAIIILK